MADHPIQGLMKTAMENLKEMIDVNTIIGDPVETPDGSVILTVSKVDSDSPQAEASLAESRPKRNRKTMRQENRNFLSEAEAGAVCPLRRSRF